MDYVGEGGYLDLECVGAETLQLHHQLRTPVCEVQAALSLSLELLCDASDLVAVAFELHRIFGTVC